MKKLTLCLSFIAVFMVFTHAQKSVKREFQAKKIDQSNLVIDGKLNETHWQKAFWGDNFVQHEPFNGTNASQKTEFSILYDDNFLYVGLKMYDNNPDSIVQRMTRRDNVDGDLIGIQLDSYHDLRTAFTFLVSAAGVKMDMIQSNDGGNEDSTWDPIWWTQTSIQEDGWTAEMKIPFTQLRFGNEELQTWGLQIARSIFRKDELSTWQHIPKEAPGWVHNFGKLKIKDIKSKKVFDFVPYAVSGFNVYDGDKSNPFASGRDFKYNFGMDGKFGITSNLTLDFTINPDFGQVEADPSEVNLSAFESYYSEKRPFFIEGRNILNFPVAFGDGGHGAENLFYSRRIGRRPHHYPEAADTAYTYLPNNTTILGAAKITGKTKDGWSIGVLETVTQKEYAEFRHNDSSWYQTVEPLTNYSVGRVQKDFDNGNTIIGGMMTSTNRVLDGEEHLDYLHTSAYSGGIDYTQYFKDKEWVLKVNNMFSNVNGSEEAIELTQTSSARYFQRPDADYVELDPTRTSLSGYGGNVQVGKVGGGKWKFMSFWAWKSPELELNDLGFMRSADELSNATWVQYRIQKPTKIWRSFSINFNQWNGWDYGGTHTYSCGNFNLHNQFINYWNFSMGINYNGPQVSNTLLRGGNAMKMPGNMNGWFWFGSNSQKQLRLTGNGSMNRGFNDYRERYGMNIGLTYKPISTLSITLRPSVSILRNDLQFVNNDNTYNGDTRYIFATINQRTINLSLRINYNITPDLSLQFWGQPFIAAGKYNNFKMITDSKADEYSNRFLEYSDNQISFNAEENAYYIDEIPNNAKGVNDDYAFSNPDFNYKQFLANFVLRWEYNPGSTVFFVWSQNRDHFAENGGFNLGNDLGDLFNYAENKSYNAFMIKFSYRFAL